MKRLLSIAVLGLAALASPASADFSYKVALSAPAGNGSGNVTATGSITVGRLGSNLSVADVRGYSLALVAPGTATVTLTRGNSNLLLNGGILLGATAANLTLTAPSINDGLYIIGPPGASVYALDYYNNGASTSFEITAGSIGGSLGPYSPTTQFVLGTISPSAVPEPSSLVLMGTAAAAGLGVWGRRRRSA